MLNLSGSGRPAVEIGICHSKHTLSRPSLAQQVYVVSVCTWILPAQWSCTSPSTRRALLANSMPKPMAVPRKPLSKACPLTRPSTAATCLGGPWPTLADSVAQQQGRPGGWRPRPRVGALAQALAGAISIGKTQPAQWWLLYRLCFTHRNGLHKEAISIGKTQPVQ